MDFAFDYLIIEFVNSKFCNKLVLLLYTIAPETVILELTIFFVLHNFCVAK